MTPLAIAATDINAGITVYYTSGPIAPAVARVVRVSGAFCADPI